jgi:hypothetical protein
MNNHTEGETGAVTIHRSAEFEALAVEALNLAARTDQIQEEMLTEGNGFGLPAWIALAENLRNAALVSTEGVIGRERLIALTESAPADSVE